MLYLQPNLFPTDTGQNKAEGVQDSPSSNSYVLMTYSLQSMVGMENMYKAKPFHRIRGKWEIVIKRLPSAGSAGHVAAGAPRRRGCSGLWRQGEASQGKLRGTKDLSRWRREFQAREVR